MQYSDVRYLHSKKPVDDRSINQRVLAAFGQELASLKAVPRVLELGAGVGTMAPRLFDWGVVQRADFTLVDRDATSLAAARRHILEWGGSAVVDAADPRLTIKRPEGQLQVSFVHGDALAFCSASENRGAFDAVTANAVLDLMDLRPAIDAIWLACRAGGTFWFTINFDGETILLPEHPMDVQVMHLFNRTIDERITDGKPAGDSKTGRHLLEVVPASGARLLEAGSSDWVVFPKEGRYENDEAYFLHHIVHTIDVALRHFTELDQTAFADWVKWRHDQVEQGQLVYIAHQLDILGKTPRA